MSDIKFIKDIHQTAPKWVEYVLVLTAAWMLAGSLVPRGNPGDVTLMRLPTGDVVKETDVDVVEIGKVALFGDPKKTTSPKPLNRAEVAASKLNIQLLGTVVAGQKSAALIKKNGANEQGVVLLKQQIQPGVTLEEVTAIDILVNNNGKAERIIIEGGESLVSYAPALQELPQVDVRPRKPTINKQVGRGYIQEQIRNFSTLLSQARVSPHFTDGQADGFTITEIVKGSMYADMGLMDGDVIQKVNGESVTGAEQAMRMYRELQSATFIDLEIMRNGSFQQISYSIQ